MAELLAPAKQSATDTNNNKKKDKTKRKKEKKDKTKRRKKEKKEKEKGDHGAVSETNAEYEKDSSILHSIVERIGNFCFLLVSCCLAEKFLLYLAEDEVWQSEKKEEWISNGTLQEDVIGEEDCLTWQTVCKSVH